MVIAAPPWARFWPETSPPKPSTILLTIASPKPDPSFLVVEKGLNKDIVINIITAKGAPDSEKLKGIEPYIYTYFSKPFDLNKLIADVNKINN